MKDLDFDELDKAVNTLMAGVPKGSAQTDDASEKTLDIPSTVSSAGQQPAAATPSPSSPAAPPSSLSPPAPSVPSAVKRTGRVMDVVRPADIKQPEPAKKISRQAPTITPPEPAPVKTAPDMPEPSVPITGPSPKAASAPTPVKSDWPDPLELANFDPTNKKEGSADKAIETVPTAPLPAKEKESSEPALDAAESSEAPLTTPFLPDTKVEKRPLGANAAKEEAAASEKKETFTPSEVDDQLPATAEDVKPLLPEELHSDLVAIESDTTEPVATETEEIPPVPAEDKPAGTTPPTEPEEASEKPILSSEAARSVPTGPTSIPQQYREEAAAGEQKSGAIYDTETYHKPLAHPAKQKSGWMWIVWILVILLVGAASGAALYFLGIYKF